MGVQLSNQLSVTDTLSNIVNEVIISNKSTCSTTATSTQLLIQQDVAGDAYISDVDLEIEQEVNANCLQSSDNNAELLAEISKKLEEKIKSKIDGQNFGITVQMSTSMTRMIENVKNSINIDNIKACLVTALNEQGITQKNIGGNASIIRVNIKGAQTVVQKCIQVDKNTTEAIAKLDTEVKKSLDNSLTGILTSTTFMIIAIVVICLIILLVFMKLTAKDSAKDSAQSSMSMSDFVKLFSKQ